MSYIGKNPKVTSVVFEGFANFSAADASPKRAGRLVYLQDSQTYFRDNGTSLQPVVRLDTTTNGGESYLELTSLGLRVDHVTLQAAIDTKGVDAVDTTANLNSLAREEGKLYYSTDEDILYTDDGTALNPLAANLGEGYWFRQTTVELGTDGVIAPLGVTGLTIGNKYKVTVTARCKRQTTAQQEIQTIEFSATPDEGDWAIELGGDTTALLGWDISAADLTTALEALPAVGVGGVVVTGSMATGFLLSPEPGDFSDIPQLTIPINTLKSGGVGGTNEVQRITFSDTPTGGTFTITFDGQTTNPIAYNATATQVRDELLLLPNINGVTVTDI